MRHEFRLADIGEGLEEAEIINWMVAVGEEVSRDQPLIEVMTDKSNAELPAPHAGVVVELGGAVGDIISVGELIAIIEASDPAGVPAPAVAAHTSIPSDDAIPTVQAPAPVEANANPQAPRPKASPSTRREAAERGIDLTLVTGTGPGGRILLSDLEAAEQTPQAPAVSATPTVPTNDASQSVPVAVHQSPAPPLDPTPAPSLPPIAAPPVSPGALSEVVPLRGVRRAVAKNMAQSWSDIPHIHAFEQIDAAPLLELRKALRAKGGSGYDQVTPLTFFVAAVAQALAQHPHANASINMADETIIYHRSVNVGVAVAGEQGLVVPVLQGADRLDFRTLARTLAELVRAAREGDLPREHFQGGTVTISNFGALGGEQALPLIRPPEAVIVGFGSIAERPFVVDGAVVARPTMHTVVGTDHRLLDGDITTAVLTTIGALLADPLQLVI